MSDIEGLYPVLNERAYEIVLGTGYFSFDYYKVIAHDITVDFLFFSESFKRTYDKARGTLMPFFSSYVRKKLFGLWVRDRYRLNKVSFQNEEDLMNVAYKDDFSEWVEVQERLSYFQKFLSNYCVYDTINLGRLFRLCFLSFLEEGGVRYKYIVPRLQCKDHQLKFALSRMRQLLRRKLEDGF